MDARERLTPKQVQALEIEMALMGDTWHVCALCLEKFRCMGQCGAGRPWRDGIDADCTTGKCANLQRKDRT